MIYPGDPRTPEEKLEYMNNKLLKIMEGGKNDVWTLMRIDSIKDEIDYLIITFNLVPKEPPTHINIDITLNNYDTKV